jgi:enolase
MGRASVPSGASTGTHEALELRDEEPEHYEGKGVTDAVDNVNNKINQEAQGMAVENQRYMDDWLVELDGTENKSALGANTILGVSLAFARAAAESQKLTLYEYISETFEIKHDVLLPRAMFNILNGGEHANWSTDIQEYMVIPRFESFAENLETASEIFHSLENILKEQGLSTNVGNEGGFAPDLESNERAFELIMDAITQAGFKPGEDVALGVDVAASEFFTDGQYKLRAEGKILTPPEWGKILEEWIYNYPIISVEDPFHEDAWQDWQGFLEDDANLLEQVVGDDLLVTNVTRIEKAIQLKACNALLVKLNQIGTLSETLDAMGVARAAGWQNIVSHRSGETEDTFIAHLAVGTGCGQIKTGAPSRGERTSKYNELLRIAEQLS